MSFIEFGALLRIDGEFVNKDKALFMNLYNDIGDLSNCEGIDENYFVYAGDDDLLFCFFKSDLIVYDKYRNERLVSEGEPFVSYTYMLPGLPKIKISHLDETKQIFKGRYTSPVYELDDWEKDYYTPKEVNDLCRRYVRKRRRYLKSPRTYYTRRYIASWEYKGKSYEVLYGHGIDPSEQTWNNIKNSHERYHFTDLERKIIDSWFAG